MSYVAAEIASTVAQAGSICPLKGGRPALATRGSVRRGAASGRAVVCANAGTTLSWPTAGHSCAVRPCARPGSAG
jgi:hypothetical protein